MFGGYSPDGSDFPNFGCIFLRGNQMDTAHGLLHNIYCPFDENLEVWYILRSILCVDRIHMAFVHLHLKHFHSNMSGFIMMLLFYTYTVYDI